MESCFRDSTTKPKEASALHVLLLSIETHLVFVTTSRRTLRADRRHDLKLLAVVENVITSFEVNILRCVEGQTNIVVAHQRILYYRILCYRGLVKGIPIEVVYCHFVRDLTCFITRFHKNNLSLRLKQEVEEIGGVPI